MKNLHQILAMKFREELGNILTAKTLYVLLPFLGWSVQQGLNHKL